MASTTTTRLALVKPTAGTAEPVNVTTQLDDNWDKVDAVVGLTVVTSSTRPAAPWQGQTIYETDTGRPYFHNGSAPASGGWKQMLAFGTASTHGTTGSAAPVRLDTTAITTTGNRAMAFRKSGASNDTYLVDFDGNMQWGPADGSTGSDTNLYRSAANVLKTDDSLIVGTDLTVTGVITPSYRVKVTSDQTSSANNTTLFNVTELVKSIAANKKCRFLLQIAYACTATADAKVNLTGPSGVDFTNLFFRALNGSMAFTDGVANGAVNGIGGNGTTTPIIFRFEGWVTTGANAGSIQVQMAKNVAESSTFTIYAGSFMELEPMN